MIGTRTVSMEIPEDLHTTLKQWAAKEGQSKAELAAHLLTQAIRTYTSMVPYNPGPNANPHRRPLTEARAVVRQLKQQLKVVIAYERPLRTAKAHGWPHDPKAAAQAADDLKQALTALYAAQDHVVQLETLFIAHQRMPTRAP